MSLLADATIRQRILAAARPRVTGRVSRILGLSIEVRGLTAAVGDAVFIHKPDGGVLPAEVVAVDGTSLTCMPLGDNSGVRYGEEVEPLGGPLPIIAGKALLGRVVDGLGNPIDTGPPLTGCEELSVDSAPPHVLRRDLVDRQIALGIRAIDTAIPCGVGQRMGILAGSGVGKSTLLGMIAKGTDADVSVVTLVGERGREVREFIERDLGEALTRSVVIVATSDQPALVRIRAAFTGTRIAEWFRDQGNHVLLMMDSITRFAMAQREVGLSAGEPPATRGYPPSVFSLLPKLLERAGAAEVGSITGLYTVLVEGDDMNEPIADTTRSILDGHIVLSRRLATGGHYPSIDVLESVSRVDTAILSPDKRRLVSELRGLMAAYREAKDLIDTGMFVAGLTAVTDRAKELKPLIDAFLRQDVREVAHLDDSWAQLSALLATPASGAPEVAPAGDGGSVA